MGRMTYAADDVHGRVSYFGPWSADRKEGNGLMEWRSGAKYLGEWRAGKRHGYNVFVFPNGDLVVSHKLGADTWEQTRTLAVRSLNA